MIIRGRQNHFQAIVWSRKTQKTQNKMLNYAYGFNQSWDGLHFKPMISSLSDFLLC